MEFLFCGKCCQAGKPVIYNTVLALVEVKIALYIRLWNFRKFNIYFIYASAIVW